MNTYLGVTAESHACVTFDKSRGESSAPLPEPPAMDAILSAMPHLVLAHDAWGKVIYVNRLQGELLRLPMHLLPLGRYLHDVQTYLVSDTPPEARQWLQTLLDLLPRQDPEGWALTVDCPHRPDTGQDLCLRLRRSPMAWGGTSLVLVFIEDVSREKRQRDLSRIFLHDLTNIAGSLSGLLSILADDDDLRAYNLALAEQISLHLIDELDAQRQMLDAESAHLQVYKQHLNSLALIERAVERVSHHAIARKRRVEVDPASADTVLVSDEGILLRVLVNMLKNALEAIPAGESVRFGVRTDEGAVVFWVHNEGVIPAEIQTRIFYDTISTKGRTRGLGTYSMKLLGETYLGGQVSFESQAETGTTFCVALPRG
ncbi:MAG: hypothetical protein OHK0039_48600 [Bacteroidia bacterium]